MENSVPSELPTSPDFPLLSTGPLWLVLILLLFVGAWWWWKRTQGGGLRGNRSELSIQILATRPLGPRSHLAIVEAAGLRSLIATTAQGVHYLRDLPAPEAGPESPDAPSFADHLEPPEGRST